MSTPKPFRWVLASVLESKSSVIRGNSRSLVSYPHEEQGPNDHLETLRESGNSPSPWVNLAVSSLHDITLLTSKAASSYFQFPFPVHRYEISRFLGLSTRDR